MTSFSGKAEHVMINNAENSKHEATDRIVDAVHARCKRLMRIQFVTLCFGMMFSALGITQPIYKCPNSAGQITMQDSPCESGSGATKERDGWISLDEKRRRDQFSAEEARKAEAAADKLKSERVALLSPPPTTSDLLGKIAEPLGQAIGCGKNVEQAMARVKPWVEKLLPPQSYAPKNSSGSARDQYSTYFVWQINYYEDLQRQGKTKTPCKEALKAFDMLNADDIAPPKPKNLPRVQVVSDVSLYPKKGRRIEIHVSDANFSKNECQDVIAKYRITAAPDGQISVHKPSARFKNLMTPWCVENFDGKALVFNDYLF